MAGSTSPEADIVYPGKSDMMDTVIAVDLGATNIRVAWVSEERIVGDFLKEPTPRTPLSPSGIAGKVAGMIRALQDRNPELHACAIGISVAGPVDLTRGAVVRPPNIAVPEIPLVHPIHNEFNIPVRIINDCPAGALGELYYGDGRGCRNFVYITLSTGIGAGVIENGRLITGKSGNAAEIGHFYVDSPYDATCSCGHHRHWEAYASGRYIPVFFRYWCSHHGISPGKEYPQSAEEVFERIRSGYPGLSGFIDELARINAHGISDVVVAYDPSRIILDGSVIRENADLLLPAITDRVDRFLPVPEITLSRLYGLAPLLGASVIAGGYHTSAGPAIPGAPG